MNADAPNVLSLYDESGNMLRPWAEAGYNCYCVDILNQNTAEQVGKGWLYKINADMYDPQTLANAVALRPVFMASFPPLH